MRATYTVAVSSKYSGNQTSVESFINYYLICDKGDNPRSDTCECTCRLGSY